MLDPDSREGLLQIIAEAEEALSRLNSRSREVDERIEHSRQRFRRNQAIDRLTLLKYSKDYYGFIRRNRSRTAGGAK